MFLNLSITKKISFFFSSNGYGGSLKKLCTIGPWVKHEGLEP